MARFAVLAMAIFTFMAGISIFNEINDCYCGTWCGNQTYYHCQADYGYAGTGHRIVNWRITPLISYESMIRNDKGEVVNVSSDDFNKTIQDMMVYKSPSNSVLDFAAMSSLVLNSLILFVNTFFLPIAGLLGFLTGSLGVPTFIALPVCVFMFLTMIIGIMEFVTNRVGWF